MSGETWASGVPDRALCTIPKPFSPRGGTASCSTPSITAAGGASAGSRASSASIASGGPSTSMTAPRESLRTNPSSPSSAASRCTYGLKPTPWTTPSTRTRTRRLFARSLTHLVEHEAEQQVVGDEHGALAALRPVALGEPQRGSDHRVEPHPDEKAVGRARPRTPADALGQQPEDDAEDAAHRPVHELDLPAPLASLPLAHGARRRVLPDQARVDGEHAHAGHRHRPDDPAQLGMDDLAHMSSTRTW